MKLTSSQKLTLALIILAVLLAVTAAGCLLTALFLVPVARLQTPRQMPWEENDYEYDEAWR